jgi:type II secretory pathway component PulJ
MSHASVKKKHTFTLLEILIACVLASVLLSFLFTYFRQTLVRKQQLHTIKEKVMQIELVRLRLTHLFDRMAQSKGTVQSVPHEEADGKALLLYADQGIDPQAAFNGASYVMLYKTRDKRLALCRWDKEKKEKRIDTLLKKVESVTFSYFADGKWEDKWPKKKGEGAAPLMVKVLFEVEKSEKDKLVHTFVFSCCAPEILSIEKQS